MATLLEPAAALATARWVAQSNELAGAGVMGGQIASIAGVRSVGMIWIMAFVDWYYQAEPTRRRVRRQTCSVFGTKKPSRPDKVKFRKWNKGAARRKTLLARTCADTEPLPA